jgi:serine/threonine-protein kinase RsbW
MAGSDSTVRLEFPSTFEMIDLVQVVSDHVCRQVGLDDDALHWVGVAVRESVINAIKHGNRHDVEKLVMVEFSTLPSGSATSLVVLVQDQGEGFDPDHLADPLAPENLLKSSGRGIFFMRSFMDDVTIHRRPEGGMEVRMVKSVPHQLQ